MKFQCGLYVTLFVLASIFICPHKQEDANTEWKDDNAYQLNAENRKIKADFTIIMKPILFREVNNAGSRHLY